MKSVCLILFCSIIFIPKAFGWHDETHIAVAKAARYYKWYNAAGPDIAKIKAGSIEGYNHYYDNPENIEITHTVVYEQVRRYNNPSHRVGHLYGAIIASLREYRAAFEKRKYAEYHLAYSLHYIADLSQPLHNVPYDEFNKKHHSENDGTVNKEVLENIVKIRKNMYPVDLRFDHFEEDLAGEISRIANISRHLGRKLQKEKRNMTKEEAYIQLGHSASLLESVLKALGKAD
jgi:hypothetical protein